MTNYPQQPLTGANRGLGENSLSDPSVRMVLSMSPLDGSLRPLPTGISIQELANGAIRANYPDGSVRELIPGAEGEGRMITTLTDGTRIQSDLSMGEGQVTVASIASTGEKTFLSLNENGANMQRISSDGNVSNVIPENTAELVQSFREVEAFAEAEELRHAEQFPITQEFGEWNNYGKPVDWQPEQNWQPAHDPYGDGIGISSRWDQQEAQRVNPVQEFGEWNNYGKPVDWQPEQNWQPPQQNWQPDYNFQPPQYFAPQFHQGFQQNLSFTSPQGMWQPPQFAAAAGFFNNDGFLPPPFKDASGFPIAPETSAPQGHSQMFEDSTFGTDLISGDGAEDSPFDNHEQSPQS